MSRSSWLARSAGSVRVLVVAALAVAAAGVQLVELPPEDPPFGTLLLWPLLAAGFAATELRALHLQVGREARTISLSEVPLLLGLAFAAPFALLAGKLAGSIAVFVFHRRQRPVKLVLNTAVLALETVTALTVFTLLLRAVPPSGPGLWLAGYAATVSAATVSHLGVTAAIAAYQGCWPSLRAQPAALVAPVVTAAAVSTVGLVAVHSLHDDLRSAALLAAVLGLLLTAYRAYARLVERHASLERLHTFSRTVSSAPSLDEVLRNVLEQACDLLHAECAEVRLVGIDPGDDVVVALRGDGELVRRPATAGEDLPGLRAQVLRTGRSLLAGRADRDPLLRAALTAAGHREEIIVALPGSPAPMGTLSVADRLGDVRGFSVEDLRLLETVASQAAATLQSGRLLARIRHDAAHDGLTGLANRGRLLRRIAGQLEAGPNDLAVLVLDVEGFRDVNDGLGHRAGDELLVAVAERLAAAVPPGSTVARLTGAEFGAAIPVPSGAGADWAVSSARMIRSLLSQPVVVHGVVLEPRLRVGLALAPQHSANAETLLQYADLALTEVATSGLGVQLYRGGDAVVPERLALMADLRQALADGTLEIHVQPKAALCNGAVVGVEALVRWTHPRLGPIGPDIFVPIAERSGLIVPLTTYVLDLSIAAAARWLAAGTPLNIAVNLSPDSLRDDAVVGEVMGLLARHGLPPGLLTLEVTEGSVIADPERAIGILNRLRDAGVRLALDDFGTGYSSLSHLKRLPVHEVKIDRGFVRSMSTDTDDAAIVRSIVDLGTNLGLEVVAEGVEDQTSWEALDELGCTLAQGYHLARPMPVERLAGWLAEYDPGRVSPTSGRVPVPLPQQRNPVSTPSAARA